MNVFFVRHRYLSSCCLWNGMGLGVSVREPFKSRICFAQPSSSPSSKSCWFSKPDVIGVHLSRADPPGLGSWCRAQTPRSSGGNRKVVIPLLLMATVLGVWVLTRLSFCPYLSHCGFFFIVLVVKKNKYINSANLQVIVREVFSLNVDEVSTLQLHLENVFMGGD